MNARHWIGVVVYGLTMATQAAIPQGPARASIDLASAVGAAAVGGNWRYHDVAIVPVQAHAPDANGQPTGAPVPGFDFTPHAGGAAFDDSAWPVIAPETLAERRGSGRLAFNWYRIRVTIPAAVDGFDTAGATVVFTATLDDYAEVWVDGELPRTLGENGGAVVAGWNAPNRLVAAYDVRPGQTIQLAVFGMNGPISATPSNFIWVREARLEFYPPTPVPFVLPAHEVNVEVERLHVAIDAIVPANPKLYKLAQGFMFTEGPVWLGDGRLLFSDPNANRIYAYTEPGRLEVFRERSGYAGADVGEYSQPGSNGLTLDANRHLVINEHGNRRVSRLETDGSVTVIAERVSGKRLNSPNDLVYKSDGTLYFTDPPFGLPKFELDPRRELDVSGVYRVADGVTELLASDLKGPNGIAFSPDERSLYVGNWDPKRKVVMRYPVMDDGRLGAGTVFFDMTSAAGEEAIDGIKVDTAGNLYVSGPGGVWILDAAGIHLGTIRTPKQVHNMAFGGADGRTLYMTAHDRLYRMPVLIPGRLPGTAGDRS